jgi:hypothetical protein
VIITKAEDARLTAALRDSALEADDPWSRYQAIGVAKADFQPINTTQEAARP